MVRQLLRDKSGQVKGSVIPLGDGYELQLPICGVHTSVSKFRNLTSALEYAETILGIK